MLAVYDGLQTMMRKMRRQAARPAHLEVIKPMVEQGELRAAGAILDDAGDMVGSAIFAEFPTREHLDAWLAREPWDIQQKGLAGG